MPRESLARPLSGTPRSSAQIESNMGDPGSIRVCGHRPTQSQTPQNHRVDDVTRGVRDAMIRILNNRCCSDSMSSSCFADTRRHTCARILSRREGVWEGSCLLHPRYPDLPKSVFPVLHGSWNSDGRRIQPLLERTNDRILESSRQRPCAPGWHHFRHQPTR